MKLFASGDHHFVEGARWSECLRIHDWIAERVEAERPDMFCSAGDMYDRASTPLERSEVAEWVQRVANVCPVVIVKGNHDRPRDCELLAKLKARHPIIVEERAAVHVVAGVAIGAVAWPHRASLAAALGQPLSGETLDDAAREALRAVLLGLRQQWADHEGPRILLGHFMVDGSVTSVGQPLIGAELNVGLADLGLAQSDMVIMGHIHKPQEWMVGDAPAVYTGSPFRTAFGETEEKSIVVVEYDRTGIVGWERVPTPCAPMILLEARWTGDAFEGVERLIDAEREGAEVRFRYHVDADHREAAKAAACAIRAELLELGAAEVKLDEQVRTVRRARAPELAAARTLEDKLDALWKARNDEPTDERRARLVVKVQQVEEEHHAA